MSKKLKIKFWKAERALAMQILEQEGLPERKGKGDVQIANSPELYRHTIYLRGERVIGDLNVDVVYFDCNQERDQCLDRLTQAITNELFTGDGELKVGEMCEFRVDEHCLWSKYKLLAILPEEYNKRYIVSAYNYHWMGLKEARPLTKRTEPKVETNGEIIMYTWEEK